MKKLILLLTVVLFFNHLNAQQFTSIHHEQQVYYNAQQKSTEWYEQNVNTKKYDFADQRSSTCTLNKVVYGWHPYWVGSAYNNYDWNLLSHFSFFSYEVDANTGNPLTTHGWATSDAVDSALANNVKVTLCVTLFGGTGLTTFLTNNTAKQNLISNLITLVQDRGAHGVNIDFEGLPAAQKTNFANFMVDLSNQMHTAIPGSEVSTVLYAVDWSNVFDFQIMDPVVDHFIVMGYAYYYQGSGNTGPCDPLYHFGSTYNYTLSKTITYYLDQGCSSNKLVMGLPYYGYEWPTNDLNIPSSTTGSGVARTFAYVKNNTSGNYSTGNYTWDADSYTDIYAFNSGGNKQCFITLENGFDKRLQHINQSGIAGIGIWALGYDNGYNELWTAIENNLTDCKVDPCSGTIHDFGGPTKNYYNDEDYTWTLSPDGATSIDLNFTSFSVEVGYDTLFIYDGASTASPLIGAYTGTNSPGSFSTSTGDITFYWKSDGATVGAGWNADYTCVAANPQPNFTLPTNTTFCQGETIQFTNTSTASSSYYWEFQNGTPATSTDTDPLVTYFASGTYNVTLNAIDAGDTNTMTQQITVNVTGQPTADFTSNSPVTMPNSAIYFTNNSTNASIYEWDFGDGNTSSDANPWNNYAAAGDYIVTLISFNGVCPNDTLVQTVQVIDNVGLSDQHFKLFGVYPNPFIDQIILQGDLSAVKGIRLVDASGKLIYESSAVASELKVISDLSKLAAGTYILEILTTEGTENHLLIKK
ncbi:glycosyl hydrolase family 18 protein [Paracrocinitomix mangrovi]|uniref:glycosyl hydrolase family 18 protein n=1 Tax=Paracrocinitomix mangrovi TaxID=2862509 RepID=UPI001C8D8474|nr:glycosyl hydrolase family 18 protein [Paracrocinitomix mangrovi]UKN00098.1 glycosyl hydrolase family 18 protein [Paracrocinitomix mangrovi]